MLRSSKLDVQPDKLVLSGDHHNAYMTSRMDGTSQSDVWKVRDWVDIQDSPDIIRRFAFQLEARLISNPRVSTITADHESSFDDFCLVGLPIEFSSLDQLRCVIGCETASKKTVLHRSAIGRSSCLLRC